MHWARTACACIDHECKATKLQLVPSRHLRRAIWNKGECMRMRPGQKSGGIRCKWMVLCMLVWVHCLWAFRVVVFQNSVFTWTCPDSRILDKFPYEIRKIRTGWHLCMYSNSVLSPGILIIMCQGPTKRKQGSSVGSYCLQMSSVEITCEIAKNNGE